METPNFITSKYYPLLAFINQYEADNQPNASDYAVLSDAEINGICCDTAMFNKYIHNIADDIYISCKCKQDDPNNYQEYINLSEFEIGIRFGKYMGAQVYMTEHEFRQMNATHKKAVTNFLKSIKKKYHLKEYELEYQLFTGEVGYKLVRKGL